MFDQSNSSIQGAYSAIVGAIIALIVGALIRIYRRKNDKLRPAIYVGIYNIALLLLYLLGMLTQVKWEGFGFLPLAALTLPWSWIATALASALADHLGPAGIHPSFLGTSLNATLLITFVLFNVLCGGANSLILYLLLRKFGRGSGREEVAIPRRLQ